jgi:hypothetical protein
MCATGSYIRGTNGTSNGIVPMLRVFNDTARYVDQGGGKRKGSLLSTSKLGMQMFLISRFEKRIQEKKRCVHVIYSLQCGLLICL